MKKILIFMAFALGIVGGAVAQNTLNNRADAIVGTYSGMQGSDRFRAKITKFDDGTYRAQIIWLEHDRDDKGNKILDKKNPDKSLRNIPADRIVLFSGLRYNVKEHRWDGTKIYDPQRNISFLAASTWRKTANTMITTTSSATAITTLACPTACWI